MKFMRSLVVLLLIAFSLLGATQARADENIAAKERELAAALYKIRVAIYKYSEEYRAAVREKLLPNPAEGEKDAIYPKTLNVLVEGYNFGKGDGYTRRFLNAIPADPFNPPEEGEEPSWKIVLTSNGYVYDVHSHSEKVSDKNRIPYSEW